MKERGMIFNGEMVRAILDGRKTQTRRIVKGTDGAVKFCKEWDINGEEIFVVLGEKDHTGMNPVLGAISCPFGAVGDRIWVRETFQGPLVHEELFEEYSAYPEKFETPEYCEYAADGGVRPEYCDLDDNLRHGWRPSIHMPRWASRILLEITNVRVERLKNISDRDAICEGCSTADMKSGDCVADVFARLWASIYGSDSWNANPWVWVIEFKRVEGGAA
ncbi:morphogenetic protein [Klebsiella pneumoniae]|uniref:morphogenetic protein n=1 Tax=Klebsiella pneumoniae TaxID=573 RepID=UPI00396FEEBF|nr:morphogenetic protein [Klebsiella pneumoniae]HBT5663113.1 morphogenetic protein [Klebsiella pneumoniae]HBY4514651.1 morphogenetic protein [Klebsiella pneumoniae]HCD2486772.1 morphogenetic protein [Klebsiella pneumoniae]